jgi:hypothetical protein
MPGGVRALVALAIAGLLLLIAALVAQMRALGSPAGRRAAPKRRQRPDGGATALARQPPPPPPPPPAASWVFAGAKHWTTVQNMMRLKAEMDTLDHLIERMSPPPPAEEAESDGGLHTGSDP